MALVKTITTPHGVDFTGTAQADVSVSIAGTDCSIYYQIKARLDLVCATVNDVQISYVAISGYYA